MCCLELSCLLLIGVWVVSDCLAVGLFCGFVNVLLRVWVVLFMCLWVVCSGHLLLLGRCLLGFSWFVGGLIAIWVVCLLFG